MKSNPITIDFSDDAKEHIRQLIERLEAFKALAESSAADCSAGGPAAPMASEPNVQPADRSLQEYKSWLENKIAWMRNRRDLGMKVPSRKELVAYEICLQKFRGLIEGEAG